MMIRAATLPSFENGIAHESASSMNIEVGNRERKTSMSSGSFNSKRGRYKA